MIYREYTSSDLTKCLTLLRAGHDRDFSEARFKWLHQSSPHGKSRIVVCEDHDNIVGMYSIIPKIIIHQSVRLTGGRDIDPVVHPDYRGKGLFSGMINYALNTFSGFDLLFNFANRAASFGFMKHGWKEVESLGDYVYQLGMPSPSPKEFVLWLLSLKPGVLPATCREIHKNEARAFIQDSDIFSELCAPAGRLWVERSPEYLAWRYLDTPLKEYRWFLSEQRDLGTCLAICNPQPGIQHLEVVDVVGFSQEPDIGNFLREWKRLFPGYKVVAWSTVPKSSASGFVRNPFAARKSRKFLVRAFPGSVDIARMTEPGSWFLTRGDLEVS